MNLLWVVLGGGVGSGLRYLTSLGAARWLGAEWPYGTLAVNLAGSFLLAALLTVFARSDVGGPGLRLALTTGMMGGLTTYSTFNFEALGMLEGGRVAAGLGYFAITASGCLLAGVLGLLAGRAFGP